jgi:hypothetical protein
MNDKNNQHSQEDVHHPYLTSVSPTPDNRRSQHFAAWISRVRCRGLFDGARRQANA